MTYELLIKLLSEILNNPYPVEPVTFTKNKIRQLYNVLTDQQVKIDKLLEQSELNKAEIEPVNRITVHIVTELDCDWRDGEYSLYMLPTHHLCISNDGREDDISLIREAITENLEKFNLPDEGTTEVVLIEDGEWEDVFFHKYFSVESSRVIPYEEMKEAQND